MVKVNTTLVIDEELKNLAKARKISMSKTLNDALTARLALPNTEEELIVQEHNLKQELEAIVAKKAELKQLERIQTRKGVLEEMAEDVAELRAGWAKKLEGKKKDEDDFAELLTLFCNKWKVERALGLAYAEGNKEVSK